MDRSLMGQVFGLHSPYQTKIVVDLVSSCDTILPMATQTYKTLKNGTVLRKGDEWENKGEGDWTILPNTHFGDAIGWTDKFQFRRPIKPSKVKKVASTNRPCYIFLDIGETILQGDEFYAQDGEWLKVSHFDIRCSESGTYRRKVN
jgi:hypothetical protein